MAIRTAARWVPAALAVAAVAAGLVGVAPAAPAQAAATPAWPLHTTGADSLIYDAAGAPVRLTGFNWNGTELGGRADGQKAADVCGMTWRTPTDSIGGLPARYGDLYARLVGWGYNTLRLPVSWNNLEPTAPAWTGTEYTHTWNPVYLADLEAIVSGARAAGLMVILDMHEDFWSPALHHITNWDGTPGYCEGSGMPRWMYPSIDAKATTLQSVDYYNAENWFFRNLHDPEATVTHATPWQLFGAAWDQLGFRFSAASGYADYRAVIGADILNEPYYSYVGGSPPAGQSLLQAAGTRLQAFYAAIGPVVAARDPGWLLFFEDSTGGYNSADPTRRETPAMTGRPAVPGNWVYSFHDYNFGYETFEDGVPRHDDFGISVATAMLANATAWRVPLYVGEFTNFTFGSAATQTDATMAQTDKFLAWAKTNRVSWTFWAYVNPSTQASFLDPRTNEPYPVIQRHLAAGLDTTGGPPPPGPIAQDGYGRTVAGGWGTADAGGVWIPSNTSAFAVGGGVGTDQLAAGSGPVAYLGSVASSDTDLRVTATTDKPATGSGVYLYVVGRRVTGAGEYRAKVRLTATGAAYVTLERVSATGAATALGADVPIPGPAYTAGTRLAVRLQVTGTNPTTVRAAVWPAGGTEPGWQATGSDGTAALQVAGGLGLGSFLSSSATNAPVTVSYDDLLAVPTGTVNRPPVASVASSCPGLGCTFDGTGSTDPDGSVTAYGWTFGDGATATGATPAHTYAAAGSYQVTLTVTDALGATGTATTTVTVAAGQPSAVDSFARTVTGGWGTADSGGTWIASSPGSSAVAAGTGTLVLTAGTGPAMSLTGTSTADTDLQVTVGTDKPATGGGVYLSALVRRVAGQGDYRAQVRLLSTGQVGLSLLRVDAAGVKTAVRAETVVPGLAYTPDTALRIRLQSVGTGTTTLRAKVWPATGTEPAGWTQTGTDTTAGLQAAGGIGLVAYLSGSSTNAPVTARFDDLRAGPAA